MPGTLTCPPGGPDCEERHARRETPRSYPTLPVGWTAMTEQTSTPDEPGTPEAVEPVDSPAWRAAGHHAPARRLVLEPA